VSRIRSKILNFVSIVLQVFMIFFLTVKYFLENHYIEFQNKEIIKTKKLFTDYAFSHIILNNIII
jgi:hypothetical protein